MKATASDLSALKGFILLICSAVGSAVAAESPAVSLAGIEPYTAEFDFFLDGEAGALEKAGSQEQDAAREFIVVTEKIFERPGLGTLFLDAFFARDIPVVQGCVLIIAIIYVGVNLLVDLAYGVVDPRVRLS